MTKVYGIGITNHARQRAEQRFGVVLPDEAWTLLAESIAAGEHLFTGTVAGGGKRYLVGIMREDGKILRMPVVFSMETKTIITVLAPRSRDKAPKRPRER